EHHWRGQFSKSRRTDRRGRGTMPVFISPSRLSEYRAIPGAYLGAPWQRVARIPPVLFLATTSISIFALALPASAQISNTNEEEIIVTARKREESILKVPVNETVLSGALLDQHGTKDLYDVATLVPN